MNIAKKFGLAAAFLLAMATEGHAGAIYDYDFRGTPPTGAVFVNLGAGPVSFDSTPSGFAVGVTEKPACCVSNGPTGVSQSTLGIGATGNGGGFQIGTGTLGAESLVFDFLSDVQLLSVTFSTATIVDILVDSVEVQSDLAVTGAFDTSSLAGLEGQSFEIRFGSANAANFRIAAMSVMQSQVPIPSTLALMGLGLVGIGYRGRKQIKAA